MPTRLVVGISGSSGALYGIRLLRVLARRPEIETHLVLTNPAKRTILHETEFTIPEVEALATCVYDIRDIGAAIASGSFKTVGMVVAPCSVKTLSAIANCYADNLLTRAADVTLKEGRRLVILLRETPLHLGHLRLMRAVAEAGGVILPPVPAFYHHPKTIEDLVDHTIGRVLDRFGIEQGLVPEWRGSRPPVPARRHEAAVADRCAPAGRVVEAERG
ncbi:MAG: UbiX family flavin prenyltransferase [Candidatus Rokubacteria bacterium]|nr:UbiX family flavin prenyltransferase [Candidatus Rokubacteria bacterium]